MELYMMLVIFDQSEGERQSKVVLNYCDPAIICITLCLKAANLKLIIDNIYSGENNYISGLLGRKHSSCVLN